MWSKFKSLLEFRSELLALDEERDSWLTEKPIKPSEIPFSSTFNGWMRNEREALDFLHPKNSPH